MAELSNLEKRELISVFQSIKKVRQAYGERQDSIEDIIHNQVELKVSGDEKAVLEDFMYFAQVATGELETLMNKVDLLEQHFI